MTTQTCTSRQLPPSVRGMWTVSAHGVLLGAWKDRAEMDEWLERIGSPESVVRVSRDEVEIVPPRR